MSELERIEDEHGAGAALGMLMAFVMMLCLGGCDDVGPARLEGKAQEIMTVEGLEGCVIREVQVPMSGDPSSFLSHTLTIVRCPNSTTTTQYRAGKVTHTVAVTDGCTP